MKTEIIVLLDRSGSMSSIKSDMEGGFNSFIEEQKKIPGECHVTLVHFDDTSRDYYWNKVPLHDVGKMYLNPRGNTPLNDALCLTIDEVGTRFRETKEKDRPEKVIFVVITDGQENASRQFRFEDVERRVGHQKDYYNWHFVFLGANLDAFTRARYRRLYEESFGLFGANTIGTHSIYNNLSNNIGSLRSGMATNMSFTPEQLKEMEATVTPDPTTKP